MSFFKKLLGVGKKVGDPLGLISKKNKWDFKNWKDPLNLYTERSGSKAGGAGGVGGAAGAMGDRANPGLETATQNAFAQNLPQMLGQQSLFARPEAAQFLAGQQGVAAPQWAGGPPPQAPAGAGPEGASPMASIMQRFMAMQGIQPQQGGIQPVPEDGMMYAGGTPGFYSGGRNTGAWGGGPGGAQIQPAPEDGMMYAGGNPNFDETGRNFGGGGFGVGGGFMAGGGMMANPFMAAARGGQPGPPPDMQSILARFRGTLGNGGGVTMPTSQRRQLAGKSGYMRFR